jgi:hypothetical protein
MAKKVWIRDFCFEKAEKKINEFLTTHPGAKIIYIKSFIYCEANFIDVVIEYNDNFTVRLEV